MDLLQADSAAWGSDLAAWGCGLKPALKSAGCAVVVWVWGTNLRHSRRSRR